MSFPTPLIRRGGLWALGCLAALALWWISAKTNLITPLVLSSPEDVAKELLHGPKTVGQRHVFEEVRGTMGRMLAGWAATIGIGLVLGVLLGAMRKVETLAQGPLEFLRAVPPVLLFPLLAVVLDYRDAAYVWTIIVGCTPIMVLVVARGTAGGSRIRRAVLIAYKVRVWRRVLAALLEVGPYLFLGARLTASTALIIAVVSEMVIPTRDGIGIGSSVRDAGTAYDAPRVIAGIMVVGAVGVALNLVLNGLERVAGGTRSGADMIREA
ncbi:MAG TPA: hypothetical protein VEL28_17255 [Candidatus Binatia bacterium]|nr:hypothetical protein [Candidatus Binatia bacterium]